MSSAARGANNELFACNWTCCRPNRITIRTTETLIGQRVFARYLIAARQILMIREQFGGSRTSIEPLRSSRTPARRAVPQRRFDAALCDPIGCRALGLPSVPACLPRVYHLGGHHGCCHLQSCHEMSRLTPIVFVLHAAELSTSEHRDAEDACTLTCVAFLSSDPCLLLSNGQLSPKPPQKGGCSP